MISFSRSSFSLLLLISLFAGAAFGQQKMDRTQRQDFNKAEDLFAYEDYVSALSIYQGLHKKVPKHALLNHRIGVCLYQLRKDPKLSMPYFQLASDSGEYEAWYYLARCHHHHQQFDSALKYFRKYSSVRDEKDVTNAEVGRFIDQARFARQQYQSPVKANISNLGKGINSPFPDYGPMIPADGSELFFTSRREGSTGEKKDPYGQYFEDVYHAFRLKNGTWSVPLKLDSNINTDLHDAGAGLAPDGQSLVLFRTSKDLLTGDLYWSDVQGSSWSAPVKLGPEINSKDHVESSASFSPDGSVLYFSSDRPGGYGGKDIYRVVRFGNGLWSLPSILGPTVNTPYDEDAPFIHPDGKTLFFSSKGHSNMGGYDIFQTRLDEDGLWTLPENLGAPINSVNNDIYFVLTLDGKTGYCSSDRDGGFGATDLYQVVLPDNQIEITVIKGLVQDAETGEALWATISVEYKDDDFTIQGTYSTNSETGKFLMVLDPDAGYRVMVEADGYITQELDLYYPKNGFQELNRNFKLQRDR